VRTAPCIAASQSIFMALVFLTSVASMGSAHELLPLSHSYIPLQNGFARVLRLDRPVRAVIIGDPKIAEATVQDEKMVVFTARAAGETDVIILDDQDNQMLAATLTVAAPQHRVEVHTRLEGPLRQGLHSFYGYDCSPVCVRVKDEVLSIAAQAALQGNNVPVVQQNIEQPPQQQNTPQLPPQ
jgi:Pilus formation protein N terminal region